MATINIKKKHLFFIIAVIVFFAGVGIVISNGPYTSSIPNPGHGADGILVKIPVLGEKTLQDAISEGDLVSSVNNLQYVGSCSVSSQGQSCKCNKGEKLMTLAGFSGITGVNGQLYTPTCTIENQDSVNVKGVMSGAGRCDFTCFKVGKDTMILFGGGYQTNIDNVGCKVGNPAANEECKCPDGYTEFSTIYNNANDNIGHVCYKLQEVDETLTSGYGFGGAYETTYNYNSPVLPEQCLQNNPATGSCSCSPGFTSIETSANSAENNRAFVCYKQDGSDGSWGKFGGTYNIGYTYLECKNPNPLTGQCYCPGGANTQGYTAIEIGAVLRYSSDRARICYKSA